MVSRFLRNLLGRRAPLPREQEHALAELDALSTARPALGGPASVLREILSLPQTGVAALTVRKFDNEAAQAKLGAGVPLLRGESVTADASAMRERFVAVCAIVERHQPSGTVGGLSSLVPHDLLLEVLAGRADTVATRADALGLDAALAGMLLRHTWLPLLAPLAEKLHPLRTRSAWDRGYCPICGSWPLLGEFRGLEQIRLLRCALCATGWECPRLRCPLCDNCDHRQLGYLHADGEQERYRAATCDACRGYVKMVATLDRLSMPRLLVADLAMLHLDLAATERGYCVV